MNEVAGQTALVTGAGTGIGRAIAIRLAEEGANVIVIGRTESTLQEAANQHERISWLVADIGRSEDLNRIMDAIEARYGKLDILVNNAGVAPVTPFVDLDMAEFDKVFQSNVRGLVELTHKALPMLKERKGNIVNISTSIVDKPMANMAVYAASKAAVNMFTRVWAKELAADGIRVNSVGVGPIETPIYEKTNLSPEEAQQHIDRVKSIVPLGRFGTVDEVAEVVLFLASARASYVTGADYAVDGGFAA
ncbi:SDR family oxidoreductase [Bradyrhizobium huanghuaihaiense]|uniref:SDR family NAD(P)-dependent oxidoreductase n=1 Tax=Bradyrhizobium huanghuaihaiense TaxID=990078 RepID=UPI0021AAD977|nr:SDR family oxidoreductase [Bradyrhizobium sp. CB3035]UWU73517.1 SDR family oxidoreductase [Bradyrhizobium sp. CB3035]